MNKRFDDKLASDFSQLRDEERQAAPSYNNVSEHRPGPCRNQAFGGQQALRLPLASY